MFIEVRNPVTGQPVGRVEGTDGEGVREAVARARKRQPEWARLPFKDRARIVGFFHDLILARQEQIMDTIQTETGKTRRDALGEVVTVAGTARYYLSTGQRHLSGRRRSAAVPALTKAEVVYKPHGVIGLITPWNYPFILGIADAIPALLAGNAVVIKPSELTPLSAVLARDLFISSGLSPDLLILVHGSGEIGAELVRHVDYVGFTGGTSTGRKVAVASAERLIPYSLELGGKNPMVVLEGASLDDAAMGLMIGCFSNSGQTCIAVERVYVQESIYEEFVRRAVEGTRKLKLGWSRAWDLDMGSLISETHAKKVMSHVEGAVGAGAKILVGGKWRKDLGPSFVEPTILADVNHAMPISREETFGPVVAVYPVRDGEEAISRANDSEFGLNASVWAGSGDQARLVAKRLETGSAAVNSTLLIYNSFDVPMGGVKQSGTGRRHGEEGILRYTQAQSIVSSPATAGGFDSLVLNLKSDKTAHQLMKFLRLWRKIGF